MLNARVNLICYLVSLVVAFFTRKVFLDQLGTEFIGFTGALNSLLGFLNLAELGVGSAIGYVLYKPIFDKDRSKINEIISVFGYLYRCIGLLILGIGILLSLFLPLIFPDTSFSWIVIYFGFYAYLASSMLGYFVNYRQTLLSADQRNYEVTGYFQAVTSGKMILQMVLAVYIRSLMLYLLIELLFGILYSFVLTWRINKTYPWLESDIGLGRELFKKYPEIVKYVKQLFVHKIAGFIQYQVTPFLIYSYVSLPMVALYGNYTLITGNAQRFLSGVMDSTSAGVGSLIAEGNKQKIFDTYKELFAVRSWLAGVLAACIFYLGSPFIANWLGHSYVMADGVVFMITVYFFMNTLRGVTDQYLYGYGLFYDVWAPAVEAVVFVIVAMIGGAKWGLPGVLCGPVVSMLLVIYIWKPYFLFTRGFQIPPLRYWAILILSLFPLVMAFLLSRRLSVVILPYESLAYGWKNWMMGGALFFICMTFSSFVFLFVLSPGLRGFVGRWTGSRRFMGNHIKN